MDNIKLSEQFSKELKRLGNGKRRSLEINQYLVERGFGSHKKLERHSECASWFIIKNYFEVNKQKIDRANFCRQRIVCPACDIRRSLKLYSDWLPKIQKRAKETENLYFLTLTIKNDKCLGTAFNKLAKAFQTLRKSKGANNPFKSVLGFFGQYEITRRHDTWHPHLHLVVELPKGENFYSKGTSPFKFESPSGGLYECHSEFQFKMIQYWHSITEDSFIVDFRPITKDKNGSLDASKAVSEVLKYVAKPCDEKEELEPKYAFDIALTLKGRRLLTSGGTFKDFKDTDSLFDDDLEGLDFNYLITHYLGNGQYSNFREL